MPEQRDTSKLTATDIQAFADFAKRAADDRGKRIVEDYFGWMRSAINRQSRMLGQPFRCRNPECFICGVTALSGRPGHLVVMDEFDRIEDVYTVTGTVPQRTAPAPSYEEVTAALAGLRDTRRGGTYARFTVEPGTTARETAMSLKLNREHQHPLHNDPDPAVAALAQAHGWANTRLRELQAAIQEDRERIATALTAEAKIKRDLVRLNAAIARELKERFDPTPLAAELQAPVEVRDNQLTPAPTSLEVSVVEATLAGVEYGVRLSPDRRGDANAVRTELPPGVVEVPVFSATGYRVLLLEVPTPTTITTVRHLKADGDVDYAVGDAVELPDGWQVELVYLDGDPHALRRLSPNGVARGADRRLTKVDAGVKTAAIPAMTEGEAAVFGFGTC